MAISLLNECCFSFGFASIFDNSMDGSSPLGPVLEQPSATDENSLLPYIFDVVVKCSFWGLILEAFIVIFAYYTKEGTLKRSLLGNVLPGNIYIYIYIHLFFLFKPILGEL